MTNLLQTIASGAEPSFADVLSHWGSVLPLLGDLESTEQDAGWHAEGNVRIHTEMVMAEAYALLRGERADASEHERAVLVLGALLHDIAKPVTTREREIDGRIRLVCPKHELRGRSYLAMHLAGHVPLRLLTDVMSTTGYHNALKLLVVRNRDRGAYLRLARHVSLQEVYWLEVADIRGRECEDKEGQLEILELFRMFAVEYGLWEGDGFESWERELLPSLSGLTSATADFAIARARNDLENGLITTPDEAIAKSYQLRKGHPEVVVMVGLSGSGKSTFAKTHLDDHAVISLDEIRDSLSSRENQQNNSKVVRIAKEELRKHLRARGRVVWDATSLRIDFRSAVIDLAMDYGALITIVAVHASLATLQERDKRREHPVPAAIRAKQVHTAQWPELREAHRFITVDETGRVVSAHGCPSGLPYGLVEACNA